MSRYLVRDIRIPIDDSDEYAVDIAKERILSHNVVATDGIIYKKSVDMRHRERASFVCSVLVTVDDGGVLEQLGYTKYDEEKIEFKCGAEKCKHPVGVLGFGPCGMFAALTLAENGYPVVVFERGGEVYERQKSVEGFDLTGTLDTESNVQFGAGGAGTFSDGKLVTRINDKYCRYVLEKLHSCGASESILYDAKPHIGTDKLLGIVDNIDKKITSLGGIIHYNCRVEDIINRPDGLEIVTPDGSYACCCLVLALGHSARDTYQMLLDRGAAIEQKPFSVGLRCEHLQSVIDRGLYGSLCDKYAERLPKGEYALSHRLGQRGVYTFCMCPGGRVVASASEAGGVVTNGMSNSRRDGKNANAAVAVSILPSDCESTHPLSGVEFQRSIERAAYNVSHSYKAPCQTLDGFMNDRADISFTAVRPTYMNGNVAEGDINKILPRYVCDMLKLGFKVFGKKIKGFDSPKTPLTAPETRTSSPVRIMRGEAGECIGIPLVYPCGEGAGCAGGITSAAVDGIKTAIKIMERFKPI